MVKIGGDWNQKNVKIMSPCIDSTYMKHHLLI